MFETGLRMNRIPFVWTPCYWKRIFLDGKHMAIRDGTRFNSAKKSIRGLTQVRSDPSLYLCPVPNPSTEPREPAPSPLSHFVPVALSPFFTPLTQALSALTLRSSVNVLPSFPSSHTPLLGALSTVTWHPSLLRSADSSKTQI